MNQRCLTIAAFGLGLACVCLPAPAAAQSAFSGVVKDTSGAVVSAFAFADERSRTLDLMQKYAHVPMSMADACLVRMTEIVPDPLVLTTDSDFHLYRRHSRQVIPCVTP